MSYRSNVSCPLCQAQPLIAYWPNLKFSKCTSCGLVFRNPMPSYEELQALYEHSWKHPEHHQEETGGTTLELARTYTRKLLSSLGRSDFSGTKVLDFGAGRGMMLRVLSEVGACVIGVEPFGFEKLKKQGFQAYQSLEEVADKDFDGIITIDVIEHLFNPWATLRELHKILKPGGWIHVATPNVGGLNAKFSQENWGEARKAGHLVFFDSRSIELMFQKCGFSRIKRLHWKIRYTRSPFKSIFHYALQYAGWDGELRYLAWKM
ncbi:MAG: class I SAM-dependent methyltransferase [Calditrichaeota bacterium]|nr:MAG: class I SAM-dependent methyltransferase [Calditrichota bacterium]